MAFCRSCKAKIEFVETKNGRNMPIDPEPIEASEVDDDMILINEHGETKTGEEIIKTEQGVMWYVSHFSTCPDADRWRRP